MSKRLRRLFRRYFPDRPRAERLNDEGTDYALAGQFQRAGEVFEQALDVDPSLPEAWGNLGLCALTIGDPEVACRNFEVSIRLNPDQPETFDNWGNALVRLGRFSDAENKHRRALELEPGLSSAKAHLGNTLLIMGQVEEAQSLVQQAWAESPSDPVISSLALSAALYSESLSPEQILAGHSRWPGAAADRSVRFAQDRDPKRRLKIGYVSADFRRHSCACFLLPLIRNHERSEVEVFAFSNARNQDEVTAKCQDAVDHWRDITQLSDQEVARRIQSEQIDILVDCSGHTEGNRLEVFGLRAAPIQVTWLGYPSSTGLAAMDFRFSDVIADPSGATEHLYTESLVHLTGGYHTYLPLLDTPRPVAAHNDSELRFGAFHNLAKLSETTVILWADVLKHVPNGVLYLKSKGLADSQVWASVQERFARHGIMKNRLRVKPWQSHYGQHFDDFSKIDVVLDATPYNGTTTTCEALWMGVPVITLCGDRTPSRVGASLLNQVGHPEWIAETKEEFVEIASALALKHDLRSDLRSSLRQDMTASTLGDAGKFARTLESAYRMLWQQWCDRQNSL